MLSIKLREFKYPDEVFITWQTADVQQDKLSERNNFKDYWRFEV